MKAKTALRLLAIGVLCGTLGACADAQTRSNSAEVAELVSIWDQQRMWAGLEDALRSGTYKMQNPLDATRLADFAHACLLSANGLEADFKARVTQAHGFAPDENWNLDAEKLRWIRTSAPHQTPAPN